MLSIDDFVANGGVASGKWNSRLNRGIRTGAAHWVALTDANGHLLAGVSDAYAPGSTSGRAADDNSVAESVDHFMSIQIGGAEATGMILNPAQPTGFVVAVQHPTSTDLDVVPNGFGDAVWAFDLSDVVPPTCDADLRGKSRSTCSTAADFQFLRMLELASERERRGNAMMGRRHTR